MQIAEADNVQNIRKYCVLIYGTGCLINELKSFQPT